MEFGEKLKEMRNERGMTQRELAEALHVSFQTVSKWESGINEPDFATLKELAKILSTTTSELLGEESSVSEVDKPKDDFLGYCDICNKEIHKKDKKHSVEKKSPNGIKETVLICDSCFKKREEETNERIKEINASIKKDEQKKSSFSFVSGKKSLIGGIIAGIIGAITILVLAIMNYSQVGILWTILGPILGGYALLSTIYCLFSYTYISEIFVDIASWSIKFPGIIFSFDLDGIIGFIVMKIFFMVLGICLSIAVFLLALAVSVILSIFSFFPILLYKQANH